jgi:hypothetical protein
MKNIGPCKVLNKFGVNAYEIELPDGIGISPIFNISDLYPYNIEEVGEDKSYVEYLIFKKTSHMKQRLNIQHMNQRFVPLQC